MMLSEAAHRFAPQFMMPLIEYAFFLIEAFKTCVTEVIGYTFQTLIFPMMEFMYNTVVTLNIFRYINFSFLSNKSTKTFTSLSSKFNGISASQMYSQRNEYMKDDYCGSSFDGSSNSSGNDETEADTSSLEEMPTRRGPALCNEEETQDNLDNGSDSYSEQFKQQVINTVNGYANEAKKFKTEIHDKFEVSYEGIKNQIQTASPIKLKNNVQNKAINIYTYIKEDYIMYYFEMILYLIENPFAIIDSITNYINQKREEVLSWYNFGKDWMNYIWFMCKDIFDNLVLNFEKIREGTFDYWQLVYNIAHTIQQSLIRMLKYLGGKSVISRIVIFFDILGRLQKVKKYAKGPEIVHQKQY